MGNEETERIRTLSSRIAARAHLLAAAALAMRSQAIPIEHRVKIGESVEFAEEPKNSWGRLAVVLEGVHGIVGGTGSDVCLSASRECFDAYMRFALESIASAMLTGSPLQGAM